MTPTRQEIVFFDLETGGLDMQKHAVIQIAAIAVDTADYEELGTFEQKILFDDNEADAETLAMNSYNEKEWDKHGKLPQQTYNLFEEFLEKHATVEKTSKRGKPYKVAKLAGHNAARFDDPFWRTWVKRKLGDRAWISADYLTMDTVQQALWFFADIGKEPPSYRLVDLAKYFKVDHENAHDALSDVRATIGISRIMLSL